MSPEQDASLSLTERSHWHQGITAFQRRICGPIRSSEREALWATAAIFATIAFFAVDTRDLKGAWPLKPSLPSDLNWLKLSDGKKTVWHITSPDRPDSSLRELALEHRSVFIASCIPTKLQSLPSELLVLCNLDNILTIGGNPYYGAASTLGQAWSTDDIQIIFINFFCFITTTSPEYRTLLEQKDHRALLLLAYWYAKVSQTHQWWALPRAMLECRSICMYLDRYAGRDRLIQELLQYPRTIYGITTR